MGLKQLLTNLEAGTTSDIVDSQPFYSNYNNGGPGYDDFGNSTSLFDNPSNLFKNKSFKFGQGRAFDRINGGFSDEPFVSRNFRNFQLAEASLDPLSVVDVPRGGITLAGARARTDRERIKRFFETTKGRVFRVKQTGLQFMNPKLETDFTLIQKDSTSGKFSFKNTIENIVDNGSTALYNTANRTYNPLGTNTLTQVRRNHLGLHFDKSGLLPTNVINNPKFNYKAAAENSDRLQSLFNDHIVNNTRPYIPAQFDSPIVQFVVDTAKGALGFSNPILYDYIGGPNSLLGVGRTQIRKFQDSNLPAYFRNDLKGDTSTEYTLTVNEAGYKPFPSPDAMLDGGGRRGVYDPMVFINKNVRNSSADSSPLYRENNVHTGNPGVLTLNDSRTKITRIVHHSEVIDKAIDKINEAPIIEYQYDNGGSGSLASDPADPNLKDFIKFYFDVYTDNANFQPTSRIQFRAFLESFNDNYNGDWNEFNYAGRAEPFYTYKSFKRSIDFNFKIAAQSRSEIIPLYKKLNHLVSTTAPTYSDLNDDNSARMRGTFIKITIGDLLDEVPGFFSNIGLSWAKEYPWEIKLDDFEDDVYQNPHILDVKCSFIPIHNFIPQTSINKSPFILPFNTIPSEEESVS